MDTIQAWLKIVVAVITALSGLIALFPPEKEPPHDSSKETGEKGRPKKGRRKLSKKKRRRIVGCALLLVSVTLFSWQFWPMPNVRSMTRVELVSSAWAAHDKGAWKKVLYYVNAVEEFHAGAAKTVAEGWEKAKKPDPKPGSIKAGEVNETEEAFNHSYGAVNDVTTARYLKGFALMELKQYSEAKAAFELAKTYPKAVTYDPKTREFWKTLDGVNNAELALSKKMKEK